MDLKLSKVKAQIIQYVKESEDDSLLHTILGDLQTASNSHESEISIEQWRRWVEEGLESAKNEPLLTTEELLQRHASRRAKSA